MAPRISTLCCLLLIGLLTTLCEGGVGLGFARLSPPEVLLLRSQPLLLNCSGYSEEGPLHVAWKYQDTLIRERDKHFQIFPNNSLYAERAAKKKDRRWEGSYNCLLRNRLGSLISRPIRVNFARMGKAFTQEPEPVTTVEGGQARFSCQIYAAPPPQITWYKDGVLLPQNSSRYTFLSSGTLQIHGVSLIDAGEYKCYCSNIARQKESSAATLTVQPRTEEFQAPVFLSPGGEVTADEGSPAALECLADGFPSVELSWKREDNGEMLEHTVENGNLHFPAVLSGHSGSYICTAKVLNTETEQVSTATQKVLLTVHVPPAFSKVPSNQVIPTSQTVRFECEADIGFPAPSLDWFKDGEHVIINGRIKLKGSSGNTLVVSQTVTSDSGIYQCVATNAAGTATVSARLQVNASNDQPTPPTNLKAFTMSSNAIMLSWDAVHAVPSAPIQAYTVHYVPSSGGLEQDTVSVNTSLLIERLKPYTNYTFYVRAYSNKSASEPSKPIIKMTGEDVPVAAPKITLSALSPNTLQVQWDELPLGKARGVITGHRIYYRKHKQASHTVRSINTAVTEYTITGLTPRQKYDVRVLSGTKAGFPSLSDDAFPWVMHEMPSLASSKVPHPPIVHLTVVNSTAIDVEWSMPADNPYPVHGYYLSYRQQNKPLSARVTLPAVTTKFLLSELASQSWYEVYLVAFNKKGESQESVRKIVTSSGDNTDEETVEVVEPPLQLEAEPTSSTVIRLTWKAPQTSRNISYYTVRYHPVLASGTVNESSSFYIRSTNNELIITDLQPFTLYEFAVRSHDVEKRQGPYSATVECKTAESLPSPPEELSWSPVDASSIRLNWQPPKFSNGIIIGYKILWNTRNTKNLESWNFKEEKGSELTSLLSGLTSNTLYYLRMNARNGAGLSLPTQPMHINIPVRHNNTKMPSQTSGPQSPDYTGIIIGAVIGLSCFILCIVIIKCRNRCCPSPPVDPSAPDARYAPRTGGNGFLPQLNGGHQKRTSRHLEGQEMECITPMLNHPNGDRHLDTKGGYGMCNGRANGNALQMLKSNRSSTGSQEGVVDKSAAPDIPSPKDKRYTKDDRKADRTSSEEPCDVTSSTVLLDETGSESPVANGANSSSCSKFPPNDPVPSRDAKEDAASQGKEPAPASPFSVNAFMSPLVHGPRFAPVTSSDQNPAPPEPT
ncbi:hypothetical protein JTE90_016382 [Oedothorax gibbosus]|uniref:Protogenin n=1 Tax=Oedothorax gibbosus TaxID=931172 RepID=A0AAV6U8Q9_9ARAC|nr:hypothetical protein JTE90_016382 [Oedothorax gibbosus]